MGKKRRQRPSPRPAAVPLPAAPASPALVAQDPTPAAPAAPPSPVAAPPPATRRRSWRIAGLSAVGLGALALAYHLRSVLNPVLLALFIAYMLSPIVDAGERRGLSRVGVISILYLLLLTALTAVVVLALPAAVGQADTLIGVCFRGDQFVDANADGIRDPEEALTRDWNGNGKFDASYLDRATAWVEEYVRSWNAQHPERRLTSEEAYGQLSEWARKHAGEITERGVDVGGTVARGVKTGISGFFDFVSYLVLVPIYIFFFLLGLNPLRDQVITHLPGRQRPEIVRILGRVHGALSSFFRGKLLVCLIKGLIVFLGLWICGVKFSLVFGLLAGVGSLVPFVPWILGFVPAEIAVLMDTGLGLAMVWPVAVFLAAEAAEFAVTPFVFGQETGLHPLSLILSLMLMGELFGFFGVLLAIPLASIVKILFQEFVLPPLEALARERPEAEAA